MQKIDQRTLRWLRVRLVFLGAGLCGGLSLLAAAAYRLQVRDAERLQGLAQEQYLEKIELPTRRGAILDRNGNELAISVSVESVAASPRQIEDPAEAARRLASALDLPAGELTRRLSSNRYFVWVKRRLTPDESKAVGALEMPGITLTPESRRYYPNRELAGPVLGLVGADGEGLDGLELSQDRWLRGSRESAHGLRDALGHVMLTRMPDTGPTAGHTVVTTLDATIQYAAERALAAGVAAAHAKAGSLVALDPATGDVLALAAVPGLNPNAPETAPKSACDRPVTMAYEPGSTMKVFSVAAALDAGAVSPADQFDAEGGAYHVGNAVIHDDEPHGLLSVSQIIQVSSNIGAAKIARRLGHERLEAALRAFGFGRPTHVGLPGEAAGILRPSARWGEIGLATIAFGQGITVTPLQLVSALSGIAEGGIYRPPHIVARVSDDNGNVVWMPAIATRRILSERAAAEMDAMLRLVTQPGGTAAGMAPPGYVVAGKTGTAQKVDPGTGRYSPDLWVSSFMGYVPADHPRLAMIVVVDEPQGIHLGGHVAAPIFRDVAAEALRYLGVPPDAPAVASAAPAPPDNATTPMTRAPVTAVATAPLQVMDRDLSPSESAMEVPDFTGMTIPEALRAATVAHVELEIDGSGRAQAQSPGPGPAPVGTVCQVEFGSQG